MESAQDLFDRNRRRLARDRAFVVRDRVAGLFAHAQEELIARLADRPQRYARALVLGCRDGAWARDLPADWIVQLDAGFRFARAAGAVMADEDRLPFADATFDLAVSIGVLQTVNDLPGALIQLRRALRPGGRFMGVLGGGESLHALRRALTEAEEGLTGGSAARVHPAVDPRQAPALLQRAGFGNIVVDVEPLTLRYRSVADLALDLRAAGEPLLLRDRPPRMGRALAMLAAERFIAQADSDGRVAVRLDLLHIAADAP